MNLAKSLLVAMLLGVLAPAASIAHYPFPCSREEKQKASQIELAVEAETQAAVATLRERVTPRRRILPAQTRNAAMVRSIATGDSSPVALTPSPRRTMRENASITLKPLRVGRATSNRQLLVPRSRAEKTGADGCCERG